LKQYNFSLIHVKHHTESQLPESCFPFKALSIFCRLCLFINFTSLDNFCVATITEVYKAMNKIKAGKAPGVCGIYPEYIQHGGSDALCTLHKIVTQVWKEEWHQGIIIPLYKGKGSKSECSNYRGITLLSVPGKVFAHIILARIKPTLLSHKRPQQSGFTPGRSTCDCLCNIAQQRQDFGHPTFAAFVFG